MELDDSMKSVLKMLTQTNEIFSEVQKKRSRARKWGRFTSIVLHFRVIADRIDVSRVKHNLYLQRLRVRWLAASASSPKPWKVASREWVKNESNELIKLGKGKGQEKEIELVTW